MYSQSVYGPRWFLPKRFNIQENNFYVSKNKVLNHIPDAENVNIFFKFLNIYIYN